MRAKVNARQTRQRQPRPAVSNLHSVLPRRPQRSPRTPPLPQRNAYRRPPTIANASATSLRELHNRYWAAQVVTETRRRRQPFKKMLARLGALSFSLARKNMRYRHVNPATLPPTAAPQALQANRRHRHPQCNARRHSLPVRNTRHPLLRGDKRAKIFRSKGIQRLKDAAPRRRTGRHLRNLAAPAQRRRTPSTCTPPLQRHH